jgi:hypothetical protein
MYKHVIEYNYHIFIINLSRKSNNNIFILISYLNNIFLAIDYHNNILILIINYNNTHIISLLLHNIDNFYNTIQNNIS